MKKGKNSGIKYKSISSFFKKAEDSSRDVVVSPNIEPSQEVRLDEPIGSPNVDPSLEVRGDETIVSPNVEPSAEARGVESEIDSIERDPALCWDSWPKPKSAAEAVFEKQNNFESQAWNRYK
ncbi:hypothetical protein OROHE_014673 [Orobanche hederae]